VSPGGRHGIRARRAEPFAACISTAGDRASTEQLLAELESVFRDSVRYSVTTSLSRALLAVHAILAKENRLSLPEHRQYASAVVVAARSNGVYVARTGKAVIAWGRGGAWGRTTEAAGGSSNEPAELGADATPHVTTEFFPLELGDVVLLLPGFRPSDAADATLRSTLRGGADLDALSALVAGGDGSSAALVVRRTAEEDDYETDERWSVWSDVAAPSASATEEPPGAGAGDVVSTRRTISWPTPGWTRSLPLVALGLVLFLALLLLRDALPLPGADDRSVAEAGRMIQDAAASSEQTDRAGLLSDAIALLEPRAPHDQAARALLAEAQLALDRTLNIVRVRPIRIGLQVRDDFRPAGAWKSDGYLLILDLGGQVLHRIDAAAPQAAIALRPGDDYDNQLVGRLVTAAWSPPRGVNTEGQLLVVDSQRSFIALNQEGAPIRRWWPPDNGEWQRIGPAAATFDDLFLLDTMRAEIRRYPARLPGAVGTVAARASDEPRLASAIDLATDGSLYVLLPNGEIRKLAPGGGSLPFDGAVPARPLEAPTALFAHQDLDRVWVLDPGQARVVELTVTGAYVRQFAFPADVLRGAVSLHVDGSVGEMRVLTPQHLVLVQME